MMSENKTAIVTGASRGIGIGLTKALLGRGYRVVANSRRVSASGALVASDCLELIDRELRG